jgi:pimeloyl-ACP methyl ester carboxylesterase
VAAVVDATNGPVNVLGHSHGALCAIEAALLTPNVRRLVLYEGVPVRGADEIPGAVIDRMDGQLGAGDVEGVLMTLLRDVVEMPPVEIELLRAQQDAWAVRLANARTIPRELRAYAEYSFTAARFQRMRAPTLLLVGGDSPPRELQNARAIAAALPAARVQLLAGQQHLAMRTAPDLFVNEVARFLEGP